MSNESGKGIAKSIADFFASLTKEPAEEAGGMVADRIRFWRIKQAVRLKEKLEEYLRQRGITDKRDVPLKLTVAILDGATMEEDDDLHTEWAKLLANAADPTFNAEVRVAYADILRSMNAFDARLLHEIYNLATVREGEPPHTVEVNLLKIGHRIGAELEAIELSRECLLRQRCIVQVPKMVRAGQRSTMFVEPMRFIGEPTFQVGIEENSVKLTQLGAEFVKACR